MPPGELRISDTPVCAACAGTVAVKLVPPDATTMLVSAVPPSVPVMPVAGKLVPVTVMVLPPSAGPVAGATAVTVGLAEMEYAALPISALPVTPVEAGVVPLYTQRL